MVKLNPTHIIVLCLVGLLNSGCTAALETESDSAREDSATTDVAEVADIGEALPDISATAEVTSEESDEGTQSAPDLDESSKDLDSKSEEKDSGGPPASTSPYPTTCEKTPDCGLPCGSGTCKEGYCQFIPKPGFCIVPAGEELVSCVAGGSANEEHPCLMCNPEANGLDWTSIFTATGFEPSQQVDIELADLSEGGAAWHPSTRRFSKGGYSLYAGVEKSGSYNTGAEISTTATLPEVTLPSEGSPFLSFLLWMETEGTKGYDKLRVLAVNESGSEVVGESCTSSEECSEGILCDPIAQKCGLLLDSDSFSSNTDNQWLPFKLDLSPFRGGNVRIQFHFGTVDQKINGFEGVYLDELKLSGGCCASTQDCSDGNPCSTGTCSEFGGSCLITEKADCCLLESDCDDDNPCTKNQCAEPGATCAFSPIFGCCLDDTQCDDADACTLDTCTEAGGTCEYEQTCCSSDTDCTSSDPCLKGICSNESCTFENTCCVNSFECTDDDPCTKDVCEPDGTCSHSPKPIFGCCSPMPFLENFDSGSPLPFEFENTDSTVGWQIVTDQKAFNGQSALYYGDPAAMDYDSGAINSGTATSPAIQLSPGVAYTLRAQLYMDTDWWSDSDIVSFELQPVGYPEFTEAIVVWQSTSSFPDDKFAPVEANISAFSGMAVRLVIRFDTVDKWSNYHEGVYVDDLAIESNCVAPMCSSNTECKDAVAESTETCVSGKCSYTLSP